MSCTYKPWINIQDVASKVRVNRIRGIKTGRKYDILSIWREIIFICIFQILQILLEVLENNFRYFKPNKQL